MEIVKKQLNPPKVLISPLKKDKTLSRKTERKRGEKFFPRPSLSDDRISEFDFKYF